MEAAPSAARLRAEDITKEWLELKAHVGGKQPEVVRRDRPAEVVVSLAAATALLPEARQKWLCRALDSVAAGQTRPSDLFDVCSHPRFAAGLPPTLAAQMLEELRQRAGCFPEKLKKAILEEQLPLGEVKSRAALRVQAAKANPAADEMLSRCIDFVRKNESAIQAVHALESRTYQVDLLRDSLQQVWGITWSRAAFEQKRRVVQSVVAGSPADRWNQAQSRSASRTLQPGDELVAVNGKKTWEEMAAFKDLLEARLILVREPKEAEPCEKKPGPAHASESLAPPPFASGDYLLDSSGSGWWGHASGDWLFNKSEGIYFHSASGKLFMEDPRAPGLFLPVGGDTELGAPARLRGCIRWFSRSKGFGFIASWPKGPDAPQGMSEDVFLHRSELRRPSDEGVALPSLPLVPGSPVNFDLAMQDGKPSAVNVRQDVDLHALCRAGFAGMSSTRQVEAAPIALKAESGHGLVGCFAGLVTGRHGMGGAEFVALNLAKDLATSFQGREQGGQRGAKAAMLAGFQRTQHGFVQYAQRLSDNSAKLWLSAETSACCALVFGPDKNGLAVALLADTGSGGHGLVVRRDGRIARRVGAAAAANDEKPSKDSLKVFEHGLKGPSINFPAMPGARRAAPKGFGAHACSDKGGSAAGLAVTLEACQLDWANDALMILASESFWASLDEEKAAKSALAAVVAHRSPEQALMQELQATRRGAKSEDLAVTVLRFTWVDVADGINTSEVVLRPAKRRRKTPKAKVVEEVDDIFAQPDASEVQEGTSEEFEEEEQDEDSSEQVPESPDLPHGDEEFRLRESAASSTTIKNETTTRAQPDPATSRSDERLEVRSETAEDQHPESAAEKGRQEDAPRAPSKGACDEMDDMFSEFCTELEKLDS